MRKNLTKALVLAITLGISSTVAAAPNMFTDVPAKHWSYDAVNQLAKAGIIDGYGDGTFRGDKTITRYEMAVIVARLMTKETNGSNKALVQKLEAEYAAELKKIGALDERVTAVEKKADKVTFNGLVRAKYDNLEVNGVDVPHTNNHVYLNLEGSLKVNDNWTARFQSENKHNYNSDNVDSSGSTNTIQRIWATGKVGDVGVTVGRKWDNSAYAIGEGNEFTGVWLAYGNDVKTTLFVAKPSGAGKEDVNVYGARFSGKAGKDTNLNLTVAKNNEVAGINMTSWGEVGFDTKLSKDLKLSAAYAKSNADVDNNSQAYRLDYKGTDLKVPGSYGVYLRYLKLGENGSLTHDDEWSSLPSNTKGAVVGFNYVLDKNVEWSALYADQKYISGVNADDSRKLFRTQVDFHF